MQSTSRSNIYSCVLLSILLASCVSYYKPTGSKDSTATLIMIRGAEHLGSGSLQEYEAYKDESCNPTAKFGRLAALLTYGSLRKEARIDAGKPVYILARSSLYGQGPIKSEGYREISVEVTRNSCSNMFRFSPKPNHRYQVRQEFDQDACTVSLVDLETNSEPADAVTLDSSSCPIPKL